jgi:hypothetical protein
MTGNDDESDAAYDAARRALRQMQLAVYDGIRQTNSSMAERHASFMPVYAPAADRENGTIDMRDWKLLEQYLMRAIDAPPDVGRIRLQLYVQRAPCGIVFDQTSLDGAVWHIVKLGAARLRAASQVDGVVIAATAARRPVPPLRPGCLRSHTKSAKS